MPHAISCHCGAVRIEMARPIRQLTQCNCSICRRYGALWAYQQRKAITITKGAEALVGYAWGKGTLTFYHCATCGCLTHYDHTEARQDGSDMSAVNMRNADDPARIAGLPIRLLDGAGTWTVIGRNVAPHLLMSPGAAGE